ncbi:leucyl aminopeptidase [Corynebacterium atypicum]|uniref:leucyl aminopeptidase n=1 Tax=Corynebacterium atypicum TaxID=191610 RepID=UPI001EEEF9BD|nr:leucyl aminopeptidase [Corynebacterium atypicum]
MPKKAEALVLGVFSAPPDEGEPPAASTRPRAGGIELAVPAALSAGCAKAVLRRLEAAGVTGAPGSVTAVAAPAEGESGYQEGLPATIITVGLGDAESLDSEALRRSAGAVARWLTAAPAKFGHVATTLSDFGLAAAVEGWLLGSYQFTGFAHQAAHAPGVTFVAAGKGSKKEFVAAQITAEAVIFARDLVNTPANFCYPAAYADYLAHTAEQLGVKAQVFDAKELAKRGFGGVLAVGQGSHREPRVVHLKWKPKKAKKLTAPKLALVGKGITFDTGGISLKPARSMEDMISDMGGSAAAAAAVFAAARLDLQLEVTSTLAIAENMPSGHATRPGDVITHYGGTTSEIINTDAEGRLVLADAIAFAAETEPDYLVETSTLTGAQIVALGTRTAGVMGSPEFSAQVAAIGREVGENAWAMPLLEEHDEAARSPIADLRNASNSRDGGMLFAATYLSRFVPDSLPWAHVDIVGPSFNTGSAHGYTPKRATGTPVRTFIALMQKLCAATAPATGPEAKA